MLNDTIRAEIKQAMIDRNHAKSDALKAILNTAQMTANEAKADAVTDEMVIDAINKEIKQTKQALKICEDAGNTENDFYKDAVARISLISAFLPKQLSADEVRAEIEKLTADLDHPNMGMVMKTVMPAHKGKADGKMINQIVKEMFG